MKSLLSILVFLTAIGCSPRFIDYEAKVSEAELPESCNGLIELLESEWKTRKGRKCHYYNGVEVKIVNKYKDCLTGMKSGRIKVLFGEPDIAEQNRYYYNFHKACPKRMASAKQLRLDLDNDEVINVQWSSFLHSY